MSADLVVTVLVAVAIAVGIAGTLLPLLPGLWLIWAATLVYLVVVDWGGRGVAFFTAITVLAIAGTALAYVLPQRGASSVGVPWWGQMLAVVASVAGLFLIPVIGIPVGFAVGIATVMIIRTRNVRSAASATWTTIRAMLVASGLQLVVALVMAIVWIGWAAAVALG